MLFVEFGHISRILDNGNQLESFSDKASDRPLAGHNSAASLDTSIDHEGYEEDLLA
jgi:hypothetical protein